MGKWRYEEKLDDEEEENGGVVTARNADLRCDHRGIIIVYSDGSAEAICAKCQERYSV